MRRALVLPFVLLTAALALAFASPAWAGGVGGGETGVTDGGTVTGVTGPIGTSGGQGGGPGDGTTGVLGPGDGVESGSGAGTSDFPECPFHVTGPFGPSGTTSAFRCEAAGGIPGNDEEPSGQRGALPFTGFGLMVIAAIAAGLIASGLEMRRHAEPDA